MKLYLLFFVLFFAGPSLSATAQAHFTLVGNILGDKADGQKVYLVDSADPMNPKADSSLIQGHSFQFEGTIKHPSKYQLIFTKNTPKSSYDLASYDRKNWKRIFLYLDSGTIQLSAHIDSLPNVSSSIGVYSIYGSNANDIYQAYKNIGSVENAKLGELEKLYYLKYYNSQSQHYDIAGGYGLFKEITNITKRIDHAKWNYIKVNNKNYVGLDLAINGLFTPTANLTSAEVDSIISAFKPYWENNAEYDKLCKYAQAVKKIAPDNSYMDGYVLDKFGKHHNLSEIIPKNKEVVLLEFWASWCVPCRGEIPNLKREYQQWNNKGFDIISISLDGEYKNWVKAIEAEQMYWGQYNVKDEFNNELIKNYGIERTGIPFAILIDKHGKIITHKTRGAFLANQLFRFFSQQP
ncbi:Thiol-disulfide isomerase or thioredoxin [bacterium A37T11]|nr:Thiol-disulfide isomerase or thioredoxin [bacterium A37T11]